ncbi:MAG: hypothetical protein ABII00_13300 [Elusimicrobiota bacterium]
MIKLQRLDARGFADFERLLSGREFGGCYCSRWADSDGQWADRCGSRPHENLECTRARLRAGEHVGFLAVRENDGAVIGWTGSGPKTAFPGLKDQPGSRLGPWSDSVWCVACLAIGFSYRDRGYVRPIVDLVVEEARRAGAVAVEAYPVDPGSEEEAYRGSRKLFEAAGFAVADTEPAGEAQALRMEKRLAETGEPEPDESEAREAETGEADTDKGQAREAETDVAETGESEAREVETGEADTDKGQAREAETGVAETGKGEAGDP